MGVIVVNESSTTLDEALERALHAVIIEALTPEFDLEDVEIGVTLVDDGAMARLNAEHRGVAAPTDVLSFPMWSPEQLADVRSSPSKYPERPLLLGDIVISMETARRQADEYGHSLGRELTFLVVHGALHLLGFDHDDASSRAAMRAREEAVLTAVGWRR